ncbi:MAG: S41 family peptidase [Alphaproteobacteria bacterium]|nr:S41 family peptidase [Alphaproteobacteria bacterium]
MRRISGHRATITVGGLFVLGLASGSWVGTAAVARATDPYAGLDRFARMFTAIESDYVVPVEGETLLDAAVAGMVEQLDPHSRWMSASAVEALTADAAGNTTGFGLEVGRTRDGVVVLKVLPGSPAAREGLQRGDRILAIDGSMLDGASLDDVKKLFDGSEGQESDLEILREGWEAPQHVQTAREQVHLPATEGSLLAGDVMYVRLIDFQTDAADELMADITRLQQKADTKWAGLILDLRDNTGGLLSEAVQVTDLFLDEGPIVSVRGRRDGVTSYDATPGGVPADLPVAVLINGLSASASEIVAGALQDTHRAVLVGSQSYGKGSVQQLYRNPDGSALKLTVARYHRPSGAAIEAREGLVPDVPVEGSHTQGPRAQIEARLAALDVDADERAAITGLLADLEEREPSPPRIPWSRPPDERLPGDPVVQAALDALRAKAPDR